MYRNIPHIQQPVGSPRCGAACLQMIYQYYGIPFSLDKVWESVRQLSAKGYPYCSTYRMICDLRSHGLQAFGVAVNDVFQVIRECHANGIDVILGCQFEKNRAVGHWLVATRQTDKNVYVNDPAQNRSQGKDYVIKNSKLEDLMHPNGDITADNTLILVTNKSVNLSDVEIQHDAHTSCISIFSCVLPHCWCIVCPDHDAWAQVKNADK